METDMDKLERQVKDFLERRDKFNEKFIELVEENKRLKEENKELRKKLGK